MTIRDDRPPVAHTLPHIVKQARDSLCGLIRDSDPDAADWVDRVRDQKQPTPSVVVMGETNRGKSSLTNALLDVPGLSPVDADVTTLAYLVFEHGPHWAAHAQCTGRDDPIPVDVDDLARWTAVEAKRSADQPPTRYVTVAAPLEPLRKMTIVDTPGAGRLDSIHGELALEAAASATALLFVLDASAPMTRGELDFLCRASEHVETVMFALTKTDQCRGWKQIADDDQRLLAEHAPRFARAPIHPVSAKMHELAVNAPNADVEQVLKARSGIADLRQSVEQLVAGRSVMLREANTLRALSTVLSEMSVRLESDKQSLTAGAAEVEALRQRREQLVTQRRSSTRGWQLVLRGEVQRTRVEIGHENTRRMREVHGEFRRAIDSAGRKEIAVIPQQVDAALRLASSRVSASLSAKLNAIAEVTLAELFSADEVSVIRSQFARAAQPPVASRAPEKRSSPAEDKLLVFMGVSGGLGAGRAAVLPLAGIGAAALNPLVWPVAIVLGLGAGWWMARTRQHSADKQHFKQWLSDVIAEARSTVDQMVAEQLITAEQQLSLATDDALTRRIDAIDAALREVDKALKMDAAERNQRVRSLDQRVAEVKVGREQAERLLESIRDLRDRPS